MERVCQATGNGNTVVFGVTRKHCGSTLKLDQAEAYTTKTHDDDGQTCPEQSNGWIIVKHGVEASAGEMLSAARSFALLCSGFQSTDRARVMRRGMK